MNRFMAVLAMLGGLAVRPALADPAPAAKRIEIATLPPLMDSARDDLTALGRRAAEALGGRRISIAVADARPGDHQVIGWNEQDPVTTRDDVGRWFTAQLADALRSGGVQVVEEPGELKLSATLVDAVVRRGSSRLYVGTVTLEAVVSDASGRELWRGKKTGSADERGRLELATYVEILDKAALGALEEWWKDPQLLAALGGRPTAAQAIKPRGIVSVRLAPEHGDLATHAALAREALAGKRVSIAPFADARRGDRSVIGRSAPQNATVTTADDLGGWLSAQLSAVLREAGVEVVPQGGELNVSISLVNAMADEGDRDVGMVTLELVVTDASRRELWRGVETGLAGTASRPKSLVEALSDAFLSALDGWWSDAQFLATMGRTSLASRLPAPGMSNMADGAPRKLQNVSLRFCPDDPSEPVALVMARALNGRKVVVRPFQDARPPAQRQLLGRYLATNRDLTVTTRADVATFCAAQLAALLQKAGAEVVPAGGDLTITGSVQQFLVEERPEAGGVQGVVSVYQGTVILDAAVVDAAGKEVWTGLVLGSSNQHGVVYQDSSYQETLSDSLLRAYAELFQELESRSP